MIRLSGARVRNFKGIVDQELRFQTAGGSIVHPVIGLNESGKSTLLESLTFIAATNEDISALGFTGLKASGPADLIPISKRSSFTGDISVTLHFAASVEDQQSILEAFHNDTGLTLTHFPKKFALSRNQRYSNSQLESDVSSYTLGDIQIVRKGKGKRRDRHEPVSSSESWPALRSILQERMPTFLYVPNFLFDIPESIHLDTIDTIDPKHAFFHRLLDGILKSAESSHSFSTHVVERIKSDDPLVQAALRATIMKLQFALQQHVLGQWSKVLGKDIGTLQVKAEVITIENQKHLALSIQQDANEYKLSDRSLGFRWFFSFLMLTFFRNSRGGRQTVFLLDEPASNLHAGAQARLLSCFTRMEDCLFIYATHSHYLLNADLLPNTFVTKNLGYDPQNEEGYVSAQTEIAALPYRQFVANYPDQTDHFRVALDTLDVPQSALTVTFPCVFVEGKGDYYCIRFLKLCGAWPGDFHVHPCGGVNTMDSHVYPAFCNSDRFLIMPDADVAGTGIVDKLLSWYGEDLSRHVMRLNFRDMPYSGSESWFEEADRQLIIDRAGLSGSNKKTFHRAVELLVTQKLSCGLQQATIDRGLRICEDLSNGLSALS